MSDRVARRAVVHGLVQGVNFRAHVTRAAQVRGVAGWAANLPDGSVEIVAEGEPDAVEAVLLAASEGPRAAVVRDVETTDVPVRGLDGFARR